MLRRTPLRRGAPIKRGAPMKRSRIAARPKKPSSYRRRPRDLEYMAWVRRQPCIVRSLPPDPARLTPCSGRVEADHLGQRGLGQKADDRTCAPMCSQHHRERTDHSGAFRDLTQLEQRAWRVRALELVASWRAA